MANLLENILVHSSLVLVLNMAANLSFIWGCDEEEEEDEEHNMVQTYK